MFPKNLTWEVNLQIKAFLKVSICKLKYHIVIIESTELEIEQDSNEDFCETSDVSEHQDQNDDLHILKLKDL
jgi:hypothetical protein